MTQFASRVFGAMRLDAATFEAVEADPQAFAQAALVVVAASVATGLGLAGTPAAAPGPLVVDILASLAAWLAWAALVYYLGTRVFPEAQTRADVGEVMRTIGFSAAPGLFHLLLLVPGIRAVVFTAVSLWTLAAMVVAVRQALDYTSTARAVGVCLAGWVLSAALALVIGFLLGPAVS